VSDCVIHVNVSLILCTYMCLLFTLSEGIIAYMKKQAGPSSKGQY